MTSNPIDKAILRAFKNVKDRAVFSAALSKLRTESVQRAFSTLHDILNRGSDQSIPIEHIEVLLKEHLLDAAEFVFGKMEQNIAALDFESVLRIAPSPRCLQSWAVAGGKKDSSHASEKSILAIERFRQSSGAAMQSVLAHWFVAHAPAEQLAESSALFIVKPEARSFTNVEELLGHALRRDKDGKFTARLLMECSKSSEAFSRNLALIRGESALFDVFIYALLPALKGLSLDVIAATMKELFGDVKLSRRIHGRELSRRLVSTASAILSLPQDERSHTALTELDHLSVELENMVPEGIADQASCGIRYLGSLRETSTQQISIETAKLISIAINKIKTDTDPVLAIEATAFNLGMREVEEKGAVVAFDPSRHEDAIGGALRGDSVLVVQEGWSLGEQMIERAKVQCR